MVGRIIHKLSVISTDTVMVLFCFCNCAARRGGRGGGCVNGEAGHSDLPF
jgi:hypothetical protein